MRQFFLIALFAISSNILQAKNYAYNTNFDSGFISFELFRKMSTKDIMTKYGYNDTAKKIINYYSVKYERRKSVINWALNITGGLLLLLGIGAHVEKNNKPVNEGFLYLADVLYGLAALSILLCAFIPIAIFSISLIFVRKKVLYAQLKYYYENGKLSNWLNDVNIFKKYKL